RSTSVRKTGAVEALVCQIGPSVQCRYAADVLTDTRSRRPDMKNLALALVVAVAAARAASADTVVQMNLVDEKGVGADVGTITISESRYGLVFTPALRGLPPGLHGFHVHENPSCEPKEKDGKMVAALAAGGHFDPAKTGKHDTPWGDGHLGDLPPLYVAADGTATQPVLGP